MFAYFSLLKYFYTYKYKLLHLAMALGCNPFKSMSIIFFFNKHNKQTHRLPVLSMHRSILFIRSAAYSDHLNIWPLRIWCVGPSRGTFGDPRIVSANDNNYKTWLFRRGKRRDATANNNNNNNIQHHIKLSADDDCSAATIFWSRFHPATVPVRDDTVRLRPSWLYQSVVLTAGRDQREPSRISVFRGSSRHCPWV